MLQYVVDKPLMVPARLNMAALRAQARTGVVTPLLQGTAAGAGAGADEGQP